MNLAELITLAGTLVIMVPSADGLVVASDSRSVARVEGPVYCDNQQKIRAVKRPARTVFAITGTKVVDRGKKPTCPDDPGVERVLDIPRITKEFLENSAASAELPMDGLAAAIISEVSKFKMHIHHTCNSTLARTWLTLWWEVTMRRTA